MNTAKSLLQAVVLLLVVLTSGIAWAQTSNGTLVGSVVDPTGAVVPKATVSVISAQYGQPHETHTDSVGTYRLESLQPGTYTVTIAAEGFESITVNGVVVNGSLTTTINRKLTLAAAQQTIEVQATAAQAIDTQSGQIGENISRQEVAELPYSSLNPAELAMTLPGVHDVPGGQGAVNTANLTQGVVFSVNGTRPRSNNFLIDGQDDNDYGITGQAHQPVNWGAIQEVAILTNAYTAEYGRGGGSVTNYIYKSGTNKFHGDLWEINRNSALASIPAEVAFANPVTKNPFDNDNTFGFDVGGPVLKDKLFAFGTAQWDRERQLVTSPSGFFLPTAAGIATLETLLPNPNISLFLAAIGPLAGIPTTPSTTVALGSGRPDVEIGPFRFQNLRTVSNSYDWNYRMDWHFTDHDTLTGSIIRDRLKLSPDNFANANALPNFVTEQGGPTEIIRGQWSHTFSSSLLNELRLSRTNVAFGFDLTPSTAANPLVNTPFIQFGNDINFPSIGVDSNFPQGNNQTVWQVQEALSYTANRHTIKAGIDVTFLRLKELLALDLRGNIFYNQGGGFSSLGNFIDDWTGADPGTIARSFGDPNIHSHANMFAPYVEDTWRVRSDLTLTMGLRYEYWGALANSIPFPAFNIGAGVGLPNAMDPSFATDPAKFNSLFAFKQVPDKRNFAPRLGVAYTPHWGKFLFGDGKTVLRAGYGIFYDGLFSNIVDNTAESQPNTFGGFIPAQSGRGTQNASTSFPGPVFDPTFFNESMASNLHNPLTQQWNVGLERELPLGLVMTLAYVGTRGDRLFSNQDFNPGLGYDPSTFAINYTNPNFGEIGIRTNKGQSRYNSAQVEVERKIHSLVVRGSYTYSKFYDDVSEVFSLGSTLAVGLSSYPQDLTNQYGDWGPSNFDQRHRFSIAYVWGVPYVHHNTFLRALTDQWEWSGIASIESGTPNTVEIGLPTTGNGHGNARPNLENPNAPLDMIGIDGGNIFAGFTSGIFYDFTCATTTFGPCPTHPETDYHFIVPAENLTANGYYGPFGNVGRNSMFGPGQVYFDTSIQRDFPVHFWKRENDKISFRVEFFNALNHSNLFTPSYTFTDSNYNNTAVTINSNGGRRIKLWLKYSF
jgi:hypothetical protein